MKKPQRARPVGGIVLAAVLATLTPASGDDDGFAQADRPRPIELPRDHGNHPEFRTEWWYLTGTLESDAGEDFGFQATWFRSALKATVERASKLATRDLYFFHGALTDVERQRFEFDQKACRGAKGWASSEPDRLDVRLLGRTLRAREDGTWELDFRVGGRRVQLRLTPRSKALLHGKEPGLSRKGSLAGQASYYYSIPRLEAVGTIGPAKDTGEAAGETIAVRGSVWFDHEFGSNQLAEEQSGWDWFSVALDDGSELMLYLMRRDDGTFEATSSGTLRTPDGKVTHLRLADFEIQTLARWKNDRGDEYPSRWRLRVPAHGIDLEVRPLLADQELDTRDSTGVRYWEGLCEFRGRRGEQSTSGKGYVELVGYSGKFGARI